MGANEIRNVILASGSVDAAQSPGNFDAVLQGCALVKQAPGFFSVSLGEQNNRAVGKIDVLALQKGAVGDIAVDVRWEDSVIPGFDIDLFFLFNGALVDPPGGFSFLVQLVSDGDYQALQTIAGDAGPSFTSGIVDLFVDGVNGLDTNPGTQILPFLTLAPVAAFVSKVPADVIYNVHFVTSINPYDLTPMLGRLWSTAVKSINLIGDVQTQVLTGTATGAATTNGTTVYTDAALVLTPDAHVGQFLRVTGGARIDNRRLIIANDATSITVASVITGAAIGDPFEIIDPSIVLQIPAGGGPLGGIDAEQKRSQFNAAVSAFRIVNCRFDTAGGTQTVTLVGNVELYGTAQNVNSRIVNLSRAGQSTGTTTTGLAASGLVASDTLWFGYGHSADAITVTTNLTSAALLFLTSARVLVSGSLALVTITGGRLRPGASQVGVSAQAGAQLSLGSSSSLVMISPTSGTTPASMTGVSASRDSRVSLSRAVIDVSAGVTSDGILAATRSSIAFANGGTINTVAASRYGARAQTGAYIAVNGDGANVTGATADFAAGEAPATAGGFAAVGNAIVGSSSDGAPVLDTSVVQRFI